MSEKKRFYLMDGTQFAYRAYFAFIKRPLKNSRGINTSAPYGMLLSISKILEEEKPDAFAIAFDKGKPIERLRLYPEYKSTRQKMPEDLYESLPFIRKLVCAMNIPILEKDGFEADDLLGTIAKKAVEKGWEVILVTGDKDLMQLVDENISVLAPSKGALPTEWFRKSNAKDRFGVEPSQIIDLLALMGDSSDHVPGVPGIGEKSALKLIQEFGSLENIYKNLDKIGGSLARKLADGKELSDLSKKLVTIDTDVSLDFDWENIHVSEPNFEELMEILKELEFTSMLDKYYKKAGEKIEQENSSEANYVLVDSITMFEDFLKRLEKANRFSIDTETTSERPMEAELVGMSFAIEPGKAYYLPFAHRKPMEMFADEKINLPKKEILEKLRPILQSEDRKKIGQNLKYDYVVLFNEGIELKGISGDAMLADYLLSPGAYEHGLDVLSMKHLGHRTTSYDELTKEKGKQSSIANISPERVARYSCEDADIALKLVDKLEPQLEKLQLKKLYDEIEIPLIEVLADMEIAGVRIDVPFFKSLSEDFDSKLKYLESLIYRLAGEEFNIASPKQLATIFFEKLKLPVQKRTKTGPSTDNEVLIALSKIHELPARIIEYRELAKLIGTYVDALPALINPHTGKIHPTFQQAVTSTGRLSCRDPNLQNIPVRGEMGREIRKGFIASIGNALLSADYSQIELRMMAHLSGDEALREAFLEGKDIHASTASKIFKIPEENVTSLQRRIAKTVNFGVIYGMTAYGVGDRLDMDISDAKDFIGAYFEQYPGVAKYMEESTKKAEELGYVETILGRRRYFPELKEGGQSKRFAQRAAINTPIQGSAADLIKVAMLKIHSRIREEKLRAKMILSIHDELVLDVPENEIDKMTSIVKEIMENAFELSVPLEVSIGIGQDWLSAHA